MKKIIKRIFLSIKYRNCVIKSRDVAFDIKMDNNVRIYEKSYIANNVKIGKYSYISSNTNIYENTTIGSFCSIAPNCTIAPGNHDYSKITTHPILYDKSWNHNISESANNNYQKTVIKDDVWIGCNSIILVGVTIGTGAVIGAGTVVTKDVPDYAIVVGNPGKVIKYRFEKEKIKKILDSKWWEKDLESIVNIDKAGEL